MAGRGPAPKHPSMRGGHRAAEPMTVIDFRPAPQPDLPEGVDWPEPTLAWWAAWGRSPLAEHFMEVDWQYLADTALCHAEVWGSGNLGMLPELRIRVQQFGVTSMARAQLRIEFADADEKDSRRSPARPSARERLGELVVLPGGLEAAEG